MVPMNVPAELLKGVRNAEKGSECQGLNNCPTGRAPKQLLGFYLFNDIGSHWQTWRSMVTELGKWTADSLNEVGSGQPQVRCAAYCIYPSGLIWSAPGLPVWCHCTNGFNGMVGHWETGWKSTRGKILFSRSEEGRRKEKNLPSSDSLLGFFL